MSNHITARAVRPVIAAVIVAMSFGAAAVCSPATAAIPAVISAAASSAHVLPPAQVDPNGGPDNTQWG
jgi:hypothetical protein